MLHVEITKTAHAFVLLAAPLVMAFVSFNAAKWLVGAAVMNHPVAQRTYSALGLFGIPTHELSHLITAVFFRHRIVSSKLFAWNDDAYVMHEYNARSGFQVAGNVFIALAPFITSVGVIHWLTMDQLDVSIPLQYNPLDTILMVSMSMPDIVQALVSTNSTWELLIAVLLSFYCIPSNTDFIDALKSGVLALPMLFVGLLVLNTFWGGFEKLIGTTLILGATSTVAAIVGWLFLYSLTFTPQPTVKND